MSLIALKKIKVKDLLQISLNNGQLDMIFEIKKAGTVHSSCLFDLKYIHKYNYFIIISALWGVGPHSSEKVETVSPTYQ